MGQGRGGGREKGAVKSAEKIHRIWLIIFRKG